MARSVLMPTTQPAEWVLEFESAASENGFTLSEWVGQACLNQLEKDGKKSVLKKLPERSRPGRKSKEG